MIQWQTELATTSSLARDSPEFVSAMRKTTGEQMLVPVVTAVLSKGNATRMSVMLSDVHVVDGSGLRVDVRIR